MTDYTELIRQLKTYEDGYGLYDDAAAAIETLTRLVENIERALRRREYAELIKALRCKRDDCEGCDLAFFDKDEGWMCQYAAKDDAAADAIEALQAQLPKRGEWVRVEDEESYHYECSRCGERPLYSRYGDVVLSGACPMCGAEMEVQDGGD